MKINDKMMCDQCKMILQMELRKIGLQYKDGGISTAEIIEVDDIPADHRYGLNQVIKNCSLELISDKKSIMVEKLKNIIIELIYSNLDDENKISLSKYISNKLNYDYTYLSNIFSGREGLSIERYYITQKIERVKDLLLLEQFNLSEIAYMLRYSSVAHLSGQFKKITGLTPSQFKKQNGNRKTVIHSEMRKATEVEMAKN